MASAQATGVDTRPRSAGGVPPAPEDADFVTIGHVVKQLSTAFATPIEAGAESTEAPEEVARSRWDRN